MRHFRRSASVVASGLAGLTLFMAPSGVATANEGTPTTPVACVMEWSQVSGGLAVFSVGPETCNIELGPVSFSSYFLPSGHAKPWMAQQLHAHSPQNGGYYGPGTYQLSASTAALCNWQTDLYRGSGQSYAPHIHYLEGLNVGWDLSEGNVCDEGVSPESSGPTQPISGPGQPGPNIVVPALDPGAPIPAEAGHGIFGPLAVTSDSGVMRAEPVIERTSSVATSSSAAQSGWTTTAAVTAMGLVGLFAYGMLRRRQRLG